MTLWFNIFKGCLSLINLSLSIWKDEQLKADGRREVALELLQQRIQRMEQDNEIVKQVMSMSRDELYLGLLPDSDRPEK